MTRAPSIAVLAFSLAALACGDDRPPPPGMLDGGACSLLVLCATPGAACDSNTLVVCAENADGCLVEARTDCAATGGTCDDETSDARCVGDPCMGVAPADRCFSAGIGCEGDVLVECAADAAGCFVVTSTDCAASRGGACDDSGAAPMCLLPADPCEALPMGERCTTAGTSCDGDTLVTCAPNAFGCLVLSETDCSARAGGTCDTAAPPACTFTGDPCDGVTECAAAGVRCEGPELVSCALDGYGCLVEARTDCSDTMFGFCDADASPLAMCATGAVDRCMGVVPCSPEGRSCDADTLHVCARNAFGCLVDTATDCAATGEACGVRAGMAVCDDVCSFRDLCPAATYCDGNAAVTCASDADGCLVESARTACGTTGTACVAGACTGMCSGASTTVIDCASGTVTGNTASGTAAISAYAPCTTLSYPNGEQVFFFVNDDGPMEVSITSTRGASSTDDYDLFVLRGGDGSTMCGTSDTCVDGSIGTGAMETVEFGAPTGSLFYVVYDLFGTTAATTEFTLDVTCTPIVCGDGTVATTESCDDGDTMDGDGCDSACAVETGYMCTGEPSVCVAITP
jgi:cysteine-rich repeat protein